MIDLSKLSKSYPYLSLSRQLGIPYADVLLVSDYFDSNLGSITPSQRNAARAMPIDDRHKICQVTAAVANGEIGHGD